VDTIGKGETINAKMLDN